MLIASGEGAWEWADALTAVLADQGMQVTKMSAGHPLMDDAGNVAAVASSSGDFNCIDPDSCDHCN